MSAYCSIAGAKSAQLQAVVVRCGCGAPAQHAGAVCPSPRAIEQKGTIAYWHKNPLRRALWRATRLLKWG